MIDFRFHIVSLVAVLLALSIGVVLGTGVFGGPLLEDIEQNVDELRATNAALQDEVNDTNAELRGERELTLAAEPYLLDGLLEAEEVVIVEFEGTDGAIADQFRAAVGVAGGSIASTIEILDKFALDDQTDIDALALAIGSASGDDEEVRLEASSAIGESLGTSVADRNTGATQFLSGLEENGFVDIERDDDATGPPVPTGAVIALVGGSVDAPSFDAATFVLELASAAADNGAPILVTEPGQSNWALVETIRNDGEVRDQVSTADGIGVVAGRVAAVMALSRALTGEIGHYGTGPGATDILPPPNPSG